MKKIVFVILLVVSALSMHAQDGYIGEIRMFAGNFAPSGWALCDGSLYNISQNTALYAILGTTYGGDGRTTFALPDLRGRVAIQPGAASGLTTYTLGQKGGTETNTLITAQIPAHSHSVSLTPTVRSDEGTSDDPTGKYPASFGKNGYSSTANAAGAPITGNTGVTGASQPVNNIQPYLSINFIICIQGIFPTRD